jgi:hypothetical protein
LALLAILIGNLTAGEDASEFLRDKKTLSSLIWFNSSKSYKQDLVGVTVPVRSVHRLRFLRI